MSDSQAVHRSMMASTLPRFLTRAVFTLAAGIFLASLVFAGALLSLVWLIWSLLHGRRPTWRGFDLRSAQSWRGPQRHTPNWPGFATQRATASADVVEGQAREVGQGERLQRD
jgi:hypothetical protein